MQRIAAVTANPARLWLQLRTNDTGRVLSCCALTPRYVRGGVYRTALGVGSTALFGDSLVARWCNGLPLSPL